jgi:hypothetical protein
LHNSGKKELLSLIIDRPCNFLEAGEKLKTAKDFHFSLFTMKAADPRDRRLMELH